MRDWSRCVHHPVVSHEGFAALTVPTYRASTIVFEDAAAFAARKNRWPDGYSYGMHGTPTTRTLEAQLSELHGGARTILTPSGQAAITIIMLTLLKPGDRVLIPDSVYAPVRGFCANYMAPRRIDYEVYNPLIGAGVADLIDARTKLVWVESPGSGTMEVQDLPAIAAAAKAKGALVGCDNTWASPLLFKPLAFGADFAMEALTKYVGGHSDLLLGSVTVGDLDLHRALKETLRTLGIGVSPDEASLALRGLETMALRLSHVGRVAQEFAQRLASFPAVERVLHPALPSCPGHDLWRRDFNGASGVFSVVLKPQADGAIAARLSHLKIFAIGASWGGTRSLIAPVAVDADRTAAPWSDGPILRVSVGLEDPGDLWADIENVFAPIDAQSERSVPSDGHSMPHATQTLPAARQTRSP